MSEEQQESNQEKSSDVVKSMYDESFDISMEDLMILLLLLRLTSTKLIQRIWLVESAHS